MNTNYRVVIKRNDPGYMTALYKNDSYFGVIPWTKRKRLSKKILKVCEDTRRSYAWERTIESLKTIKEYEV